MLSQTRSADAHERTSFEFSQADPDNHNSDPGDIQMDASDLPGRNDGGQPDMTLDGLPVLERGSDALERNVARFAEDVRVQPEAR